MTSEARLPEALADLAAEVLADGSITADDVLKLRQGVFKDGVVDRDEADLMFYLDAHGRNNDEAWNAFFIEALTDYLVWKRYPPGIMSEEDGRFLVERVTRDGKIARKTEFELVVGVIEKAQRCPEEVVVLALRAVKESVLEGAGVLFGKKRRRRGVIDAADVETIKRVIYGPGGGGSYTITRREAELLFELNNATAEKKNAPSWRKMFVDAVGNFLMFPRAAPRVVDADEAKRREAWLAERRGFTKGVSGVLGGIAGEATDRFSGKAANELEEAARKEEEAAREAGRREAVDRDEAEWLIARITEDDIMTGTEKALLAYIKRKATGVHPSLLAFFDKYGV